MPTKPLATHQKAKAVFLQFTEPYRSTYLDELNEPLFAFGMGMSYSHFEYFQLNVMTPKVQLDGTLNVEAKIKYTVQLLGTEVVQLYVRDLTASVTRPLKGAQRIYSRSADAC